MAQKSRGLFDLIGNAVSDARETVARNFFRKHGPRPTIPTKTQETPPFPPPPVGKEVTPGTVYDASTLTTRPGRIRSGEERATEPQSPQSPQTQPAQPTYQSPVQEALSQKSQLAAWQSLQKHTPQASEGQTPGPDEEALDPGLQFVRMGPTRRVAPIVSSPTTQEGSEDSRLAERLREKHAASMLRLALKPKSWQELILDQFKEIFSPLTFGLIPLPRSTQEKLQQALGQFAREEPQLAQTEEMKLLQQGLPDVSREVEVQATGQLPRGVGSYVLIPPSRFQEEDARPAYDRPSFLQIDLNSARNFIRVGTPSAPVPTPGLPLGSTIRQTAGSALKTAVSQGSIGGRGLAAGAMRGAGSWLGRQMAVFGARLALLNPTGAAIGGGVLVAVLLLIILGSGFAVIPGLSSIGNQHAALVAGQQGSGPPTPQGSQYVQIDIKASRVNMKNEDLPVKVKFIITIKEEKEPFKSLSATTTVTATNKDGSKSIKGGDLSWTTDKTKEVEVELDDSLKDSSVTISVVAHAEVASQTNTQTSSNSFSVIVGNPPEECPSEWPTAFGRITQGPGGSFSHAGFEAIDIGHADGKLITGQGVMATHGGIATRQPDMYPGYGQWVTIETVCRGKKISTLYAHMRTVALGAGETKKVSKGYVVGIVGAEGVPRQDGDPNHLHYEVRGGKIAPYLLCSPDVGSIWPPATCKR